MTMSAVLDAQGQYGETGITYESIALLEILSSAERVKIAVYINIIYYL